jgi:hypothetical protein
MTEETRIALMNYDWLIRNRRDVELAWDSDTLVYGDGGCMIDELLRPGFTPATTPEGLAAASGSDGPYDEDSPF